MFVLVSLSPSGKAGLLLRSETAAATDLVGDDSIQQPQQRFLFMKCLIPKAAGKKKRKGDL
jgi:hypothetical protein